MFGPFLAALFHHRYERYEAYDSVDYWKTMQGCPTQLSDSHYIGPGRVTYKSLCFNETSFIILKTIASVVTFELKSFLKIYDFEYWLRGKKWMMIFVGLENLLIGHEFNLNNAII